MSPHVTTMSPQNGGRNHENEKPKSLLVQKETTAGFHTMKRTIEMNVLSIVYPISEPKPSYSKKCIFRPLDFQNHLRDVIRFVSH